MKRHKIIVDGIALPLIEFWVVRKEDPEHKFLISVEFEDFALQMITLPNELPEELVSSSHVLLLQGKDIVRIRTTPNLKSAELSLRDGTSFEVHCEERSYHTTETTNENRTILQTDTNDNRNENDSNNFCPTCKWQHDSDCTNFWYHDLGPFVFPSGGRQNNMLRDIHKAMAYGHKSISGDSVGSENGTHPYEVFRYSNKDAYHHLIATENRMLRIKKPGEYRADSATNKTSSISSSTPKKPRKTPKSARHARSR
jgi:hypothetical protein